MVCFTWNGCSLNIQLPLSLFRIANVSKELCKSLDGDLCGFINTLQFDWCNVGPTFERISLKYLCAFLLTSTENKYTLIVTDYFKKWLKTYLIIFQVLYEVIDVLVQQSVSWFGTLLHFSSDQGTHFPLVIFKLLWTFCDVNKTCTTLLNPQTSCMLES